MGHVDGTIGLGRVLGFLWNDCTSMTALRFMSNFSTQSRTGARDPHIGLLLLIPQFCPHRPGTVRFLLGMEAPDWPRGLRRAPFRPDLYCASHKNWIRIIRFIGMHHPLSQ